MKYHVVDSKIFYPERRILFIGNFSYIQNLDAVEWLLKDIWKYIKEQEIVMQYNLLLWVVGRRIPDHLKKLAKGDDSVLFDEQVEDTASAYHKAYISLAPIRVGGGSNLKILESMACGIPVIATTMANKGIGAVPNKEILLADTKEEYARQLLRLL